MSTVCSSLVWFRSKISSVACCMKSPTNKRSDIIHTLLIHDDFLSVLLPKEACVSCGNLTKILFLTFLGFYC